MSSIRPSHHIYSPFPSDAIESPALSYQTGREVALRAKIKEKSIGQIYSPLVRLP